MTPPAPVPLIALIIAFVAAFLPGHVTPAGASPVLPVSSATPRMHLAGATEYQTPVANLGTVVRAPSMAAPPTTAAPGPGESRLPGLDLIAIVVVLAIIGLFLLVRARRGSLDDDEHAHERPEGGTEDSDATRDPTGPDDIPAR